jgi:formylglycine-generating enzyme required for sulfatase activity
VIGRTISHYRLVAELGGGGMGVVYEAEDVTLGRRVALKVLPSADDPAAVERFKREARAAAALNHPHICVVHELGVFETQPFIVMERMSGRTLGQVIDGRALSVERLVLWGAQIADALAAAHAADVIHRDLKPANVFITDRGDAKILDFGIAKIKCADHAHGVTGLPTSDSLTAPGSIVGTVAYMSPEQCRGLALDSRTDIFSLGVLLYEMATGRRPFLGSPAEVLSGILNGDPIAPAELNPEVPLHLQDIILRALAKDREARYQSASDIQADLQRAHARVEEPDELTVTWRRRARNVTLPRRPPATIWWAAAAVLVAGAVATMMWQRWSRERWAIATALPEVERRLEAGDYAAAAALASEARAVLPRDPTLEKLYSAATAEAAITSEPVSATLEVRPYGAASEWTAVGRTPLQARVPRGVLSWKLSAPEYAPLSFVGEAPVRMAVHLVQARAVPAGMVAVSGPDPLGDTTRLGWPFNDAARLRLPDYLIDEHEVTNSQFQAFVDGGGYRRRELWTHPFVAGGRPLSWERAMERFLDSTGRRGPATWTAGHFPAGHDNYPVSGVSWYEAAAYAEFVGRQLPTAHHWVKAAQTNWAKAIAPSALAFPDAPQVVGQAANASGFGTTDMAGNVKEWCWNEGRGGRRFILGGGFGEATYMFRQIDLQDPWTRLPTFGFRTMKPLSPFPAEISAPLVAAVRDFSRERPVNDAEFEGLRRLYTYDAGELNAKVERTEQASDWTHQEVTLNAAYGGERLRLHLFLPAKGRPPWQAVIFFPGISAAVAPRFDPKLTMVDFVPRTGRALVFPIYKSTFERQDGLTPGGPGANPPAFWRDHVVMWSKDLGRTLDYLASRSDVDAGRIGYYGFSWGAAIAPTLLAVEPRVKAAVLSAGGFWPSPCLRDADPFHFAPRVRTPVLLISGRYDVQYPYDVSQQPFFRLLGPPAERKKWVVLDSGHIPDSRVTIRETLAWFDRFLGPVAGGP